MLSASIYEDGNGPAMDNIQAPALKGKALVREITDRWREIELAVEPGFHRVLIRRHNIFKVAGLQRTEMGVNDRRSVCRFTGISAQSNQLPADQGSQEKSRRDGE